MARKKGGGVGGGANWMDTYGDLVTLLLCFFVLLYAMSTMDPSKWQYIAQAFAAGDGDIINVVVVEEPNKENDPAAVYVDKDQDQNAKEIDFDDFYMYLKQAVASAGLDESVSVEMSKTGVYMKFRDSVFFAGDSYELLDEGKFILEVICDGIRAVDKHVLSIKVNGHTADSSGSSDTNEWRLSSGRADSVIDFMLSLDCCEPSKFSSSGFAKYRPIAPNDSEENRRMNRRVEIVFIRNDVDFSNPEVLKELTDMMFGDNFVNYTESEGESAEKGNKKESDTEASETVTEAAPPSANNGREYSSKKDILKDKPHGVITEAPEE